MATPPVVTTSPLPAAETLRRHWNARYAEGVTPWDTQHTPPEVEEFWGTSRLPARGIALDLGCGPGTNVRYLARRGLTAIGIEIAGAPLVMARQRLSEQEPALAPRTHFICADVCALPFADLHAVYILDVGCLHSLAPELRPGYAASVQRNLASGGYYHLYAFDLQECDAENAGGPPGLAEGEVAALFAPSLRVIEEVIARPDRRPCRWYLLQAVP